MVAESPHSTLDWADVQIMLTPKTTPHISHYIRDKPTIRLRASIEPVNAPTFVAWAVNHFLNLGILEMDKLEDIFANRR